VLPDFARAASRVNKHRALKSMDASKGKQELEKLCVGGDVPWVTRQATAGA
jgi:hypothetical protein